MNQHTYLSLTMMTAILLAAGAADFAAEPSIAPLPAEQIADLIADLDSDRFITRQAAHRKLVGAGAAAVAPLTAAAQHGSLEVSIRAINVLQRIYTNTAAGKQTVDAAELALEELMQSQNRSAAGRADAVLETNYELRERRAIAEIKRLGGVVEQVNTRPKLNRIPVAAPNQRNRSSRVPFLVRLERSWKGGDEGLKYVKRLTKLKDLYLIEGTDVSKSAIEDLQAALPKLTVHPRGTGYLAIKGGTQTPGGGCFVSEVIEAAAADKAGIKPGDVIVRFAGRPVSDFETLIELIKKTKPGDKIDAEILRRGQFGGKLIKLKVVMGGWTQGDQPAK